MNTNSKTNADDDSEQRRLDDNVGEVPIQKVGVAGIIPYPSQMIDNLCGALGYDKSDRRYMYDLFKRHEAGEATRPERLFLQLLMEKLTREARSVENAGLN